MTPEQMQKIVDGAPEWASIYSISDNCYYEDYAMYHDDILISHLRTELAKHDTLDLEPSDISHGTIALENVR